MRLVIGGDGPERDDSSRSSPRGLDARVVLAGGWMPPAVADAMAGALAVVVPSRIEAFGIVALEAWRSGAPLVMTDRGGAPGFVRDGIDGILVDPEDTAALRAALVTRERGRRAAVATGRCRARARAAIQLAAGGGRLRGGCTRAAIRPAARGRRR